MHWLCAVSPTIYVQGKKTETLTLDVTGCTQDD